MVEDRPHRRALPAREALARLARCRSTQWDPDAVDGMLGLFPARVADHGRLAS
jgi:HD-GYP domain-containing protein (c-di-GMP phosphodiesterase class II)